MTWEDLPERAAKWSVKKTILGLFLSVIALIIVFTIVGLGLGWFRAGAQVVSPQNFRVQFATAYGDYEGMKQTANNVCAFRSVVAAETDPSNKSQRISQLSAYGLNYTRLAADYDAAYDNAFRAKYVGPRDLPSKAPTLDEMLSIVNCTTPDPLAAK